MPVPGLVLLSLFPSEKSISLFASFPILVLSFSLPPSLFAGKHLQRLRQTKNLPSTSSPHLLCRPLVEVGGDTTINHHPHTLDTHEQKKHRKLVDTCPTGLVPLVLRCPFRVQESESCLFQARLVPTPTNFLVESRAGLFPPSQPLCPGKVAAQGGGRKRSSTFFFAHSFP